MNVRHVKGLMVTTAICLMVFGVGDAQATPFDAALTWNDLPDPCTGTGVYTEPHDDFPGAPGQHVWDIVGTTQYAAGAWATDANYLYFRMRVDYATSALPPGVWQFLLDLDPDHEGVDWSLQLDNKVDLAVELVPASPGAPLFSQVNLSHTQDDGHWYGEIATYSRIVDDTGDVNLGDEPVSGNDSWVEVAVPWTDFETQTTVQGETPQNWRVYLTTSASHIQVTKDTPECGDPAVIPEPTTFLIWSLLGGLCLLGYRS